MLPHEEFDVMMRIGKYIMLLCMLAFLVHVAGPGQYADVSIKKFESRIVPDTSDGEMSRSDSNGLRKYYGIQSEDVDGFVLYVPGEHMSVQEMLIVKTASQDEMEQCEEAVQRRLAVQKKSFSGYGTEQMGLLEQAVIEQKGQYLFFGVGKDARKWQKHFEQMIEKKHR